MELLDKIKIYLIFRISLLKFADLRISISIKKSLRFASNNKYEIEKITEYNPKTRQYIIKWKKYLIEENL